MMVFAYNILSILGGAQKAISDTLWQGIEVDDAMINHVFSDLLPAHDITKDMDKITAPVLLLAGELDYDSVPLQLWRTEEARPRNFTIVSCGETGHWPNLENPELFDQVWEAWIQN